MPTVTELESKTDDEWYSFFKVKDQSNAYEGVTDTEEKRDVVRKAYLRYLKKLEEEEKLSEREKYRPKPATWTTKDIFSLPF